MFLHSHATFVQENEKRSHEKHPNDPSIHGNPKLISLRDQKSESKNEAKVWERLPAIIVQPGSPHQDDRTEKTVNVNATNSKTTKSTGLQSAQITQKK
ncbi:hypothetical protein SK128_024528 [Halocaridina rubra]|uniref:Uncharacterized protein n=1 Tax=Halocaridina rubra TaxID=373956 RepID=A0AAN9AET1_HALRR